MAISCKMWRTKTINIKINRRGATLRPELRQFDNIEIVITSYVRSWSHQDTQRL